VAKLHNALILYRRIKNSLQPETCRDFAAELAAYTNSIPAGIAPSRLVKPDRITTRPPSPVRGYLGHTTMARLGYPLMIPLRQPGRKTDQWQNHGQALFDAGVQGAPLPPAVGCYAAMASAFQQDKPDAFNQGPWASTGNGWRPRCLRPSRKAARNTGSQPAGVPARDDHLTFAPSCSATGAMFTVALWRTEPRLSAVPRSC